MDLQYNHNHTYKTELCEFQLLFLWQYDEFMLLFFYNLQFNISKSDIFKNLNHASSFFIALKLEKIQ